MKLRLVAIVIVSTITTLHAINDTSKYLDQQNALNVSALTSNEGAVDDTITNLGSDCTCANTKVFNKARPIEGILTSPNYPNPYPTDCECKWEISVPDGYSINVIVEELDLDGKAGDYLFFRGGKEGDVQEKGPVLTWNLKKEQMFKIHHNSNLFVQFVSKQTDKNHGRKGFKLRYEQYGELTTTAVPTTSTTPLPTSEPDGSRPDILVNLTGMMPIDFNENKEEFQKSLAKFAETFCEDIGLELDELVTSNNVKITLIGYCPRYWPDRGSCVQVQFSLPVVTKSAKTAKSSGTTKEYQLSKQNLEKMWTRFAETELRKLQLGIYEVPDDGYYLSLWMGVALGTLSIVLLAFLGILYWIWRTSNNKDYSRFGSNSEYPDLRMPGDGDFGLEVNSKRLSAMSLCAAPHQLVPALFGDDTETRVPDSQAVYHDLGTPQFSLYPYQNNLPSYGSSERTSEDTRTSSGQSHEPRFQDNRAFESDELQERPLDEIVKPATSEIDNGASRQIHLNGMVQNESKI